MAGTYSGNPQTGTQAYQNPGTYPGQYPSAYPDTGSGTVPGAYPGGYPGSYSGTYPAGVQPAPGMMPGAYPGQGTAPGMSPYRAAPIRKETPEEAKWGRIALGFIVVIGILFLVAIVVAFMTPEHDPYADISSIDIATINGTSIWNVIVSPQNYQTQGRWDNATQFRVTVHDGNYNPVSDCEIKVDGCNIQATQNTDNSGRAIFGSMTRLNYVLDAGVDSGTIEVTASKSDHGSTTRSISVTRGNTPGYSSYNY